MQARMNNPAFINQDAMKALMALGEASQKGGVPHAVHELLHLRVSQINGCGVCVDMHGKMARKAGETDERLFSVAAWRDTPYFTEAERAALALAESVTRIADRGDAVSDEVWNEAARHYDEDQLASLLLSISTINVWNRLNASVRMMAGSVKWG
ncbi:carboxymuconolactone decarboxylase family protein [Caulobacter sp. Root1472]|uniref:carboxymuconolactone decarboxylase family protein n=1 Tax=Caulobacter sp. Root1472 TaxID=1736470 RepID=UPI0006FD4DD5|nr:carboxymuconolactone decarboxylase family protein [Caulobacter sp. Root1472]KQZ33780.1 alkylhydroperoxidase [Caulobacter sp. Root1472]